MTQPPNHRPDRIEWIEFHDRKILFIEFNHATEEQSLLLLRQFVEEVSIRENDSILFLASLTHAGFRPSTALKWQDHQELIHSKCERMAAVGARGIIAIAIQTFLNLAQAAGFKIGHKVRYFEDPELAKRWLVGMEP